LCDVRLHREGLARQLEGIPRLKVVGTGILSDALQTLRSTPADVALLDGRQLEIPAVVESHGQVVTFWTPFPNQLPAWIANEVRQRGKTIAMEAASALAEEQTELGASCGQLMIAHTLSANSKVEVTAQQLFQLRKDGMGWGQIAAGLGFNLGDAVSAVNAEGRVAGGEARADGKVAAIGGPGARSGLGIDGGAGANLGVGHGAHGVGVGAGAGLGVGIKVGH